jgi:type II secretory pathway component PulF
MTPGELIALNDQIAAMARAGLPLDRGLSELAREMRRGRLRTVTEALANDLRSGKTLPEAVAQQKRQLPSYYSALLTAGMRSGRLPEVLATLGGYTRQLSLLGSILIEALFYPAIVLIVGYSLFLAVLYFIAPQFKKIFDEFGLQLPAFTQLFLDASDHLLVLAAAPIGAVIGVLVLYFVTTRTPRGKWLASQVISSVPIIGKFLRSARLAAFTELLALLVKYGVPLPEAFRLAGQGSSDAVIRATAEDVALSLERGTPLGQSLQGRGLVPEWTAWMTANGEARGDLADTLEEIAELYRRQVDGRAAILRSILPGALIFLVAGLFIGSFVMAMFLPLIKLLEGLSK